MKKFVASLIALISVVFISGTVFSEDLPPLPEGWSETPSNPNFIYKVRYVTHSPLTEVYDVATRDQNLITTMTKTYSLSSYGGHGLFAMGVPDVSPDGKYLILGYEYELYETGVSPEEYISVNDAQTGEELKTIPLAERETLRDFEARFSVASSRFIKVTYRMLGDIIYYDIETGEELPSLTEEQKAEGWKMAGSCPYFAFQRYSETWQLVILYLMDLRTGEVQEIQRAPQTADWGISLGNVYDVDPAGNFVIYETTNSMSNISEHCVCIKNVDDRQDAYRIVGENAVGHRQISRLEFLDNGDAVVETHATFNSGTETTYTYNIALEPGNVVISEPVVRLIKAGEGFYFGTDIAVQPDYGSAPIWSFIKIYETHEGSNELTELVTTGLGPSSGEYTFINDYEYVSYADPSIERKVVAVSLVTSFQDRSIILDVNTKEEIRLDGAITHMYVTDGGRTGIYTFTDEDGGTHQVVVDFLTFEWRIDDINIPPEFINMKNRGAVIGRMLEFKVEAKDPNDPTTPWGKLTYSAGNLPPAAQFDADTQTFSWQPIDSDKGIYNVTFTVRDSEHVVNETITIPTVVVEDGFLTQDSYKQIDPAIYGDYVVFSGEEDGNSDIYLYDLLRNTNMKLTYNLDRQVTPDIHGYKVVWLDDSDKDIYMYDILTSNETKVVSTAFNIVSPAIFDNRIAWSERRTGTYDIYVYDITGGGETHIETNDSSHNAPAIYEDKVFWTSNVYGDLRASMYDLATGVKTRIGDVAFMESPPGVHKDKMVVIIEENGKRDVVMYDLSARTQTRITNDSIDQYTPLIYDDKIVYKGVRSYYNEDIYVYDLSTETETRLTIDAVYTSPYYRENPDIFQNTVVWVENRGPERIYLAKIYFVPQIETVTPDSVSVGELITITGSNFGYEANLSRVMFANGAIAAIESWSNTKITCTVPQDAETGEVRVVTPGGESKGIKITILAKPEITYISPRQGATGSYVYIRGENFGPKTNASRVEFANFAGGKNADIYYWYDAFIGCKVPELEEGDYKVTVINDMGRSNSVDFKVLTPPRINTIYPNAGSTVSNKGFYFYGSVETEKDIEEVMIYVYDYGRSQWTAHQESGMYYNYNNSTYDAIWWFRVKEEYITPGKNAILYANVKDTDGAWSGWKYVVVKVSDPPIVEIVSPEPYEAVRAEGFIFVGTVQTNSEIEEVRICVYDYGRQSYTVKNALAGLHVYPEDIVWEISIFNDQITLGHEALLWVNAKDVEGEWSGWKSMSAIPIDGYPNRVWDGGAEFGRTSPFDWYTYNNKLSNETGWVTDTYHSSGHSLKIVNTERVNAGWRGKDITFTAVQGYPTTVTLGGWSKAENVSNQYLYCLDFRVEFLDGTVKWYAPQTLRFSPGTHGWEHKYTTVSWGKPIKSIRPYCLLYYGATGTVWFDDVYVKVAD